MTAPLTQTPIYAGALRLLTSSKALTTAAALTVGTILVLRHELPVDHYAIFVGALVVSLQQATAREDAAAKSAAGGAS